MNPKFDKDTTTQPIFGFLPIKEQFFRLFLPVTLTMTNVLFHTFYAGCGFFNPETPKTISGNILSGFGVYTIMAGLLALFGAFFRGFGFQSVRTRFVLYFLSLQLFFIFIQSYQILKDWLSALSLTDCHT